MRNALVLLYALAIIYGTGYVVFVLGKSGWWFLLVIPLISGLKIYRK